MPLSYDLISEFVKTTKVKPQPLKESTCYGTVVSKNGTDYVKIDGSDQLTPVNTNVVIRNKDRVMVLIKNHTATVTGNETRKANQSVNKNNEGDYITLDDLAEGNVTRAEFDRLEAANLEVQNTLTAENGVIDTLNSNTAYITDLKADNGIIAKLQAEDAEINGTLEAHQAVIDVLDTTYAKIGQLDASNANITDLTTKVGKINTLIYGSASGEVIHTSFANSVIATLGDAWIKSAMIESIDTSKVTIASDDDSLRISGNLIQFKNGNDVKMQLGKDAQGKYSVVLCDENGATLLDKDGIKANAVPNQLIVNDMVSDDAAINGKKLDIDSVISEINNDGSKTISATKISVDAVGNTLDVSLQKLTTLEGTVKSQGTQISANTKAISTKVTQQEIDAAIKDVNSEITSLSTQYSTLDQTVNGISTTVANHTTEIIRLGNIEIGGRNLLLDSSDTYENADYVLKLYMYSDPSQMVAGEEYTISFDGMLTDPIQEGFYINTYPSPHTLCVVIPAKSTDGTYNHYEATFIMPDNGSFTAMGVYSQVPGNGKTSGVKNVKLEKGNKATDWTPAPEEIDSSITNLSNRIDSTETSIVQLSDKITANVTETTALGTRTSTLEQTAGGLTARLNTIETYDIGGRNYYIDSRGPFALKSMDTGAASDNFNYYACMCDLELNETYTISADIEITDGDFTKITIYPYPGGVQDTCLIPENGRVTYTFTKITDTIDRVLIYAGIAGSTRGNGIIIRNVKIEKGSAATAWSPSPDDIFNASKTATNYLNFSSGGLVIGDLTAGTLGKNVLIDSDSVDIRNGTTTLASFGADYLYLAQNSRNAKIDLCNGLATLYHESKYSYDTIFVIDTGNTTEIMGLINPLCVTSVDDLDEVSIQFANANGVMGGIGIVGNWLRRYGTNMYDKYTILDSGNYFDVMDSGWQYTGGYGSNFTQYNNETHSKVRYRKVGGVVEVRGALKATTTIEGSDTKHTMFTLPEGYRPDCTIVQRCQGSGMHAWMLTVETDGDVTFSRYGVGSSYSSIGTNVWLPLQITFLVN